jgi:hypothetical protein
VLCDQIGVAIERTVLQHIYHSLTMPSTIGKACVHQHVCEDFCGSKNERDGANEEIAYYESEKEDNDDDGKLLNIAELTQQQTQTQAQATVQSLTLLPKDNNWRLQNEGNGREDIDDDHDHDDIDDNSSADSEQHSYQKSSAYDENNPFALLQQRLLELEETKAATSVNTNTPTPRSSIDSGEESINAGTATATSAGAGIYAAADASINDIHVSAATNTQSNTTTDIPEHGHGHARLDTTQEDWPVQCADDWDYDNDVDHDYHQYGNGNNHNHNHDYDYDYDQQGKEAQRVKPNRKKRQSNSHHDYVQESEFATMHTSSHQQIIEKSGKRARKSQTQTPKWSRPMPARTTATPAATSTAVRTPVPVSLPKPMPVANESKSVEPTPFRHSIIGLRPNHWGFTATPYARPGSSKLEARSLSANSGRRLASATTPQSAFSAHSRTSRLARATTKRGPLSFNNDTTASLSIHKTPSKPTSTLTSFTPAFIRDSEVPVDDDRDSTKENTAARRNVKPWFLSENSSKPRSKCSASTPKKTAGPLQQKLAQLRASTNADIVRLQSGMYSSIHDPRKDKVYMDVELIGACDTTQLEHHTVSLGKIIDNEKSTTLAWIVFLDKKVQQKRLRIYNPIPLKIAAPKSKVTHVVIGTQFHQPVPEK